MTIKLFVVETSGKGNPDYLQTVETPSVERALIVSFPEIQVASKRFDDFGQKMHAHIGDPLTHV